MKKIVIVLLLGILLIGCSSVPEGAGYAQARNASPVLLVDKYLIGVDDQILVSVWKNPDLSITVPVRPDGRISLPLAGEVVAGGRTPEEVAAEVTERLAKFIRDPQVSVILVELNSGDYLSRVRVSGAVVNPVTLPFRQGMTVLDLVLEAGGLNEFAAGNRAKLYRLSPAGDGTHSIPIKVADILQDGEMGTNFALEPGDIITIPERMF